MPGGRRARLLGRDMAESKSSALWWLWWSAVGAFLLVTAAVLFIEWKTGRDVLPPLYALWFTGCLTLYNDLRQR